MFKLSEREWNFYDGSADKPHLVLLIATNRIGGVEIQPVQYLFPLTVEEIVGRFRMTNI